MTVGDLRGSTAQQRRLTIDGLPPRIKDKKPLYSLLHHLSSHTSDTYSLYISRQYYDKMDALKKFAADKLCKSFDSVSVIRASLTPDVAGNDNHHNQNQQFQQGSNQGGYGGQQGMPGGMGGQGGYGDQSQGQNFGVTGGPQYNAPHGSGGAGAAGGMGGLLGMLNCKYILGYQYNYMVRNSG